VVKAHKFIKVAFGQTVLLLRHPPVHVHSGRTNTPTRGPAGGRHNSCVTNSFQFQTQHARVRGEWYHTVQYLY